MASGEIDRVQWYWKQTRFKTKSKMGEGEARRDGSVKQ